MGGEGGPSGLNDWSNTLSLLYIRAWMQASAVTVWMEAFNAPSGTQQQQQMLPLACETRFTALKKKKKRHMHRCFQTCKRTRCCVDPKTEQERDNECSRPSRGGRSSEVIG